MLLAYFTKPHSISHVSCCKPSKVNEAFFPIPVKSVLEVCDYFILTSLFCYITLGSLFTPTIGVYLFEKPTVQLIMKLCSYTDWSASLFFERVLWFYLDKDDLSTPVLSLFFMFI